VLVNSVSQFQAVKNNSKYYILLTHGTSLLFIWIAAVSSSVTILYEEDKFTIKNLQSLRFDSAAER